MKIMVINTGSSSIKYKIFDMRDRSVLASGLLEKIGEPDGHLVHQTRVPGNRFDTLSISLSAANHEDGFNAIMATLRQTRALDNMDDLSGIGHRVVHGGEVFRQPTLITAEVVRTIRALIPLAPLHNPANLDGIEVAVAGAPKVPQVAIFDTAFHQTLPARAYRYALPRELYEKHAIRRYGFHGTSHFYVAKQAAHMLAQPLETLNLITLHLGNGASAAALQKGASIDTSMGMTPLEGLIMGTRCGDLDPAIVFYLARETHRSIDAIDDLLNKESGLRGISGVNDMRALFRLAEKGDPAAQLAIDMYVYRLRKYIGSYTAVLGRVDALVFTGGIGENAAPIRSAVCAGMSFLGIDIDDDKNAAILRSAGAIHGEGSRVKILVIPTDEELEIAEQTKVLLRQENLI